MNVRAETCRRHRSALSFLNGRRASTYLHGPTARRDSARLRAWRIKADRMRRMPMTRTRFRLISRRVALAIALAASVFAWTAHAAADVITIDIRAFIDGRDLLIIQGNPLQSCARSTCARSTKV